MREPESNDQCGNKRWIDDGKREQAEFSAYLNKQTVIYGSLPDQAVATSHEPEEREQAR
jgi:hypothetical protein